MKRPITKLRADTMSHSKVIRSKKSNLSLGQNYLEAHFFLVDILLRLQQQILIRFCKFSYNSEILTGLLRLLR